MSDEMLVLQIEDVARELQKMVTHRDMRREARIYADALHVLVYELSARAPAAREHVVG